MALLLLTGCASTRTDTAAPVPGTSATTSAASSSEPAAASSAEPAAAPSSAPAPGTSNRPPQHPTDAIKDTDRVVGTVIRGGSGPCYGLVTDDGVEYALHSNSGTRLTKGVRVDAKIKPSHLRIDCGSGQLVEMTSVVPLQ